MSYQVSAGTAVLTVTDWIETATSAFSEHDTWKNGSYGHFVRVYGKYHQYQLTCVEQGVSWANSAVPYLFGIQSGGSSILLQSNHPYRPLSVNAVVVKCIMNPPFEAGQNIRKFTVDLRESSSQGGGGGGGGGSGGTGTVVSAIADYDYFIKSDSTVYDKFGNLVYTGASNGAALTWAAGQASPTGAYSTCIVLGSGFLGVFVTIDGVQNLTIKATGFGTNVNIGNLTVQTTSASVFALKFENILFNNVNFTPSGAYGESWIEFEDCFISMITNSYTGILFEVTGTGSIENVYFTRCTFNQVAAPPNSGIINIQGNGPGVIYFTDCLWSPGNQNNMCFIYMSSIMTYTGINFYFSNFVVSQETAATGTVLINGPAASVACCITEVQFVGGYFELHGGLTLLNIQNSTGAGTQFIDVRFVGVTFDILPGKTLTALANANTAWVAGWGSTFKMADCDMVNSGTFSVGTTLPATDFTVNIQNNGRINPLNKATNPFDNTGYFIKPDGATTVPVASQDYRVNCAGIIITAADSSNANNAIVIKDGAGNAITAAAHTLSGIYVPYGYKINWGAFTGTAGAVTCVFV